MSGSLHTHTLYGILSEWVLYTDAYLGLLQERPIGIASVIGTCSFVVLCCTCVHVDIVFVGPRA